MALGTIVPRGLSSVEAAHRLLRDGPNVLPAPHGTPAVVVLARQMVHFFALLLWVAAALALVGGMPQLAAAIAVVVVLNGVFAFLQEWRADRAGQRLRALMPSAAMLLRGGKRTMVDVGDVVVGDVLVLEAGDRISADARVVTGDDLAVDTSLVTGESVPERPGPGAALIGGTFVVAGEALAEVTAIGAQTVLADLAAMTRGSHRRASPLTLRLDHVVRIIAVIAVSVGGAFFGLSMLLGFSASSGFLFAVGVTVALVPEGLLPTVTLSLAHAAQQMAHRKALVRHLDAVETLGATTFICTDKTGTLTRNEMSVVVAWTPAGEVHIVGQEGWSPVGAVAGSPEANAAARRLALAGVRCSTGRLVRRHGAWVPLGDPMEAALHAFALRAGVAVEADEHDRALVRRLPFDVERRRMTVVLPDELVVKGAPDAVLPLCGNAAVRSDAAQAVGAMAERGLRTLAVARRACPDGQTALEPADLELLGVVGLEDPPRDDIAESLAGCRRAGIRVAMVTGDHPGTALAVARETGLANSEALVLTGAELPADEGALGALIDRDGVVIARVAPQDKLRIARALQARGHVVAMTGDGVNDGPALRTADVGVAMGASGTDVAREAADLVLLDDHFASIVAAVALGRATYANVRRFLTYHLVDNVAELAPFAAWALSGGRFPLALTVLQILAIDIGTDLLPALALGTEPPTERSLVGRAPRGEIVDSHVLTRVFAVLGPTEAVVALGAFTAVLLAGGWAWGGEPPTALLAAASGATFAAIVFGQLATAFACRSTVRPVGRWSLRGNPSLVVAAAVELATLAAFLFVPPLARLLGGSPPTALGWACAALAVPAVLLADTLHKRVFIPRRSP